LIQYTFEAATQSEELAHIVLSTDDEEIADYGRSCGVSVPFIRPSCIAEDETPMVVVVQHAVRWLQDEDDGYQADAVMLLQPTSPLRRSFHIDEAIRCFRESDTDGVVSVSTPREHPYDFVTSSDGEMRRAVIRQAEGERRQDWPEFLFLNGAIYLVKTSTLLEDGTLLPTRSVPYAMDQRDSLDIDSAFDLQLAGCLLESCGRV
jgi:CMP-N-acetylneuraminic acid synthetase